MCGTPERKRGVRKRERKGKKGRKREEGGGRERAIGMCHMTPTPGTKVLTICLAH